MHRDQRLGLALGILLLGIVGAFFFRNEGDGLFSSPELNDPDRLDQQIAENPVTPYFEEIGVGSSPRTPAWNASQAKIDDPWGPPGFLQSSDGSTQFPGAGGPPSPIDTRASTVDGIPIPRENDAWEPVTVPEQRTGTRRIDSHAVAMESIPGYIIYQVQKGDTLSGIAEKYMGSSHRYSELYETNHSVLNSPNDLKAGMKIRIPTKTPPAAPAVERRAKQTEARPISSRDEAISQEKPPAAPLPAEKTIAPAKPSRKKFIPVRRSPLMPRGMNDRAAAPEIPVDEVPRQLTQLPPRASGTGGAATAKVPVPAEEN